MSTLSHCCGVFLALWLINKATQSGNQSKFPTSESKREVCQPWPRDMLLHLAQSSQETFFYSLPSAPFLPPPASKKRGQNCGAIFNWRINPRADLLCCMYQKEVYITELFLMDYLFLQGLICLVFIIAVSTRILDDITAGLSCEGHGENMSNESKGRELSFTFLTWKQDKK